MYQITQIISELSRSRAQYVTDRMLPYEMKVCHAMNLTAICKQPGISQDTLARQRQADKSSIARQAATLEEEGFITRISCNDDKRVLRLYPTEKALSLLPAITEVLANWENRLTQDLTAEEKEQLIRLLLRMKQNASKRKEADQIETVK